MVVNPCLIPRDTVLATGDDPPGTPCYPARSPCTGPGSLDAKRYALVMAQRAGPGIEPTAPADSDTEILGEPLLRDAVDDLVAARPAQRPDPGAGPAQGLT